MGTDARTAPPRPDLGYLRHRTRPAAAPPVTARTRRAPALPVAADDRVGPGRRRLLTADSPTVTLTRLQSGVGTLIVEAAVSAATGAAALGCAYELGNGESSTVDAGTATSLAAADRRIGPPGARRPVLVGGRDRFARIAVDLRQCRDLQRLTCFLHSPTSQSLTWGGSVVVSTLGGERVEVPLDGLPAGPVLVPLSLYQVDGELVLRREAQPVPGTVRDACRAYGFDRITWMDERTPVD
jgi:hypothetical protein